MSLDLLTASAGIWAGLAAGLLVGALAWWRERGRGDARRAWLGPAVVVRGSRARGLVRVALLAVAAASATASMIGLTGADQTATERAAVPESIVIALDISRSMDAGDAAPSRLAAARGWLATLVERTSPRAVGLIVFAGEPLLTCPLTSDLGALRLALDEAVSTQSAVPGGSILEAAIARSIVAFGQGPARRTLILVSDGEDTGEGVTAAAAAAKQAGVVVHTVGVGTAKGFEMLRQRPPSGEAPAPGAGTRITKLEDKPLRELAAATGGLYVEGVDEASLARLAGRLRAPRGAVRPPQTIWWTLLLLVSFACLLVERLWPQRRLQVAAATVASLLLMAAPAHAADGFEVIREGNSAYDAGRTKDAIATWRRAAEDPEAAALAWFNVGVGLAKQGEAKNAAMAFARAAALYKGDGAGASRAHYNRGIMLEHTGELEESARAFIAALRSDATNDDARTNLAIIRARLERDKQDQPPPPSPKDDLEKALKQVPEQDYAFNKGKKQQRPVTAGSDW